MKKENLEQGNWEVASYFFNLFHDKFQHFTRVFIYLQTYFSEVNLLHVLIEFHVLNGNA